MNEIEVQTKLKCIYSGSCDMINAINSISAELKQLNSNVQIELIDNESYGYEMVQFTKFSNKGH
jgi:hypothetical protein